jgi:hypothetical protein
MSAGRRAGVSRPAFSVDRTRLGPGDAAIRVIEGPSDDEARELEPAKTGRAGAPEITLAPGRYLVAEPCHRSGS